MKHISSDEAIQLKDKLDSLQRRYNELTARGADMLKHAQEALPLVQQFHNSHHRLVDWMLGAEATLQAAEPREEDISRLEADIQVRLSGYVIVHRKPTSRLRRGKHP